MAFVENFGCRVFIFFGTPNEIIKMVQQTSIKFNGEGTYKETR